LCHCSRRASSKKPECKLTKTSICRKNKCDFNSIWCPRTNDIPNEQLEIFLNYPSDIHMFEIQGRVDKHQVVTHFLFQYKSEEDDRLLTTKIFKTLTSDSKIINKFILEPAIRTNYLRIVPIDYTTSIAMRFEIYSKGHLYTPSTLPATPSVSLFKS
jgi:hypothetical protein